MKYTDTAFVLFFATAVALADKVSIKEARDGVYDMKHCLCVIPVYHLTELFAFVLKDYVLICLYLLTNS